MRTATNSHCLSFCEHRHTMLLFVGFSSLLVLGSWKAHAADLPTLPPLPALPAASAAATSAPLSGIAMPGAAPASTLTAAPQVTVVPAGTASVENGADTNDDAQTSIPTTMKRVIKRLDASTDPVTAADVNAVRQAIVRTDLLIELEKKKAELDKIRQMASGRTTSVSVPAPLPIPASALRPLPTIAEPVVSVPTLPMPTFAPDTTISSYDVLRVTGGAGLYKATVRMPSGVDRSVRVGDTLDNGAKVVSIDSTGVVIQQKEKTRHFYIKNVDKVFGGTL